MAAEEATTRKRKTPNSSYQFQDNDQGDNPPGKKVKVEQEESGFSVDEANFVCPLCLFPAKKYSTLQVHMLDHFDANWEANCDEEEKKDTLCKAVEVLNWFGIPKPLRADEGDLLEKSSISEASLTLELTAETPETSNPITKQEFVEFDKAADCTNETFQETSCKSLLHHRLYHNTGGLYFKDSKTSLMNAPQQSEAPERLPTARTSNNESKTFDLNGLGNMHPSSCNRGEPLPSQSEGVKRMYINCKQFQSIESPCMADLRQSGLRRSFRVSGKGCSENVKSVDRWETAETQCQVHSVPKQPPTESSIMYASYPQFSTQRKRGPFWSIPPNRQLVSASLDTTVINTQNASQLGQVHGSCGRSYRSPATYEMPSSQPIPDPSNRSSNNAALRSYPVLTSETVGSHPETTSKVSNETRGSTDLTQFGTINSSVNSNPYHLPSCPGTNQKCNGIREEMGSPCRRKAVPQDQGPPFLTEVTINKGSSRECANLPAESQKGDEPMDLTVCKNQPPSMIRPPENTNTNQHYARNENFCRNDKGYWGWENRSEDLVQKTSYGHNMRLQSTSLLNSDNEQPIRCHNERGIGCTIRQNMQDYSSFRQRPSTDHTVHHTPLEPRLPSQQYCSQKPVTWNKNDCACAVRDFGSNSCSLRPTQGPQFVDAKHKKLCHEPLAKQPCHQTPRAKLCLEVSPENSCQHQSPLHPLYQPVTQCHGHHHCTTKCCSQKPVITNNTANHFPQAHQQPQTFPQGTWGTHPAHISPQRATEYRSLSEPSLPGHRNSETAPEPLQQQLVPNEYHGHSYALATVPPSYGVAPAHALPYTTDRTLPSQNVETNYPRKTHTTLSVSLNLTGQTHVSRKHPTIAGLLQKPGPKLTPSFNAFETTPVCSPNLYTKNHQKYLNGYNPQALDRGIPSPTPMAPATLKENTWPHPNQNYPPFTSAPLAERHRIPLEEHDMDVTPLSVSVPSYYGLGELQTARRNRLPTTVSISRYRCNLCGMIGSTNNGMRRHGATHDGFVAKLHLVEIDFS